MKSISCKSSLRILTLIVLLLWTCAACSIPRVQVRTEKGHRVEYGLASWYGKDFHGRLTANGEVYDMYKTSAAHKTLPLGTIVKVTNRKNGKSLKVRINDRGPFVRGRIIDLSYGGAKALGMVEDGVIPVRVETLKLGDNRYVKSGRAIVSKVSIRYTVQAGSFLKKENALQLQRVLETSYNTVFIQEWNDQRQIYYRVRIGRFSQEKDAQKLCLRLQTQNVTAFVTAE